MLYSVSYTHIIHHIILFVKIPGSKTFCPSILSIIKKNPACRILRLRRVALATPFHSAAVRSLAERFLCHRTKFPYDMKKRALTLLSTLSKLIIVTVQYLHSHKSIFNYSASSAGACSAFMLKLIFLSASLKSTILASIS